MTIQYCEKCGSEIKEKYGSGRFCSKKCAYSRTFTMETRKKISQSLMGNNNGWANEEKASKIKEKRHNEFLNRKVCINENGKRIQLDITNRELEEYRKTHFICEMCGKPETTKTGIVKNGVNKLAIDHEHGTSKFRGLLCNACNRKLGTYETFKEKAEEYLKTHARIV